MRSSNPQTQRLTWDHQANQKSLLDQELKKVLMEVTIIKTIWILTTTTMMLRAQ